MPEITFQEWIAGLWEQEDAGFEDAATSLAMLAIELALMYPDELGPVYWHRLEQAMVDGARAGITQAAKLAHLFADAYRQAGQAIPDDLLTLLLDDTDYTSRRNRGDKGGRTHHEHMGRNARLAHFFHAWRGVHRGYPWRETWNLLSILDDVQHELDRAEGRDTPDRLRRDIRAFVDDKKNEPELFATLGDIDPIRLLLRIYPKERRDLLTQDMVEYVLSVWPIETP